jgi:hypothetical protein
MKSILSLFAVVLLLSGCAKIIPTVTAQAAGPGIVTVSWDAPTSNTDGTPISGTITYTVFEMAPCGGTSCATDITTLGTAITGINTTTGQVSGVPDGLHCYAVQTNVVLVDGAHVASALSNIACVTVAGSTAPQPTPNAPTNAKAS